MATLTIKQVPGDLYARLKERAKARRRSLNAQVIRDLESVVDGTRRVDRHELLEELRELRARVPSPRLDDRSLRTARRWGRDSEGPG